MPVPGATVVIVGTTVGVITDIDGNFQLHLMNESQIEVSFVGFNTQSVYVKNAQHLDIVLELGENKLEEVVVIGYGEQKVKHATYSVQNISLKKIEDIQELT